MASLAHFDPAQARDSHGRWTLAGAALHRMAKEAQQQRGAGPTAFAGNLKPGSQDHIRAIDELATLAGHNTSDGRPSSDTLSTSLHNVARALEARDISSANIHMEGANWANKHEAGSAYSPELKDISAQIKRVDTSKPAEWMPTRNPLMAEHQHPGTFKATPGPPVNPTRGAMTQTTTQMEYLSKVPRKNKK